VACYQQNERCLEKYFYLRRYAAQVYVHIWGMNKYERLKNELLTVGKVVMGEWQDKVIFRVE